MKVWISKEEFSPVYMLSTEENDDNRGRPVAAGDIPDELFQRFEAAMLEYDAVQDAIEQIIDEAEGDAMEAEEIAELVAEHAAHLSLMKRGYWPTVP